MRWACQSSPAGPVWRDIGGHHLRAVCAHALLQEAAQVAHKATHAAQGTPKPPNVGTMLLPESQSERMDPG